MENRNIICIPLAFKESANAGMNIKGDRYEIYLKNACVALCSAKKYNPKTEVVLASNVKEDKLPNEYTSILKREDVGIVYIPFDSFVFPDSYLWSLAFYKLCVLKHISEMNYENVCYLDADCYIQGDFEALWSECKHNILLYDINHGLNVKDYRELSDEIALFMGKQKFLTHYGGEFFAASIDRARVFVQHAELVYKKMIDNKFVTAKGDEFILSVVAEKMRLQIKNAGAYVYRFWTSYSFRLISTCYQYNPIVVIHLPDEKNHGLIKLYDSYIKKGIPLDNKIVWKKCRLTHLGLIGQVKRILKRLWRHI